MDIVKHAETGFLASSSEEYQSRLFHILSLADKESFKIQQSARAYVMDNFAESKFKSDFLSVLNLVKHSIEKFKK